MSTTTCYYHPDQIAVSICERCHRPICIEDKRIDSKTHYAVEKVKSKDGRTIVDIQGSTYDETHEYCPVCYVSQKKTTLIGALIGGGIFIIIILLFFGIALFLNRSIGNDVAHTSKIPMLPGTMAGFSIIIGFFALIIILLVILIIGGVVYIKKQTGQTAVDVLKFKKPGSDMICFECGSPISTNDQYCPSCGNDTKDEIRAFTNSE